MGPNGQSHFQLAASQNDDRSEGVPDEAGRVQQGRGDLRSGREAAKPVEIDFMPLDSLQVGEAALEGKPTVERLPAVLP